MLVCYVTVWKHQGRWNLGAGWAAAHATMTLGGSQCILTTRYFSDIHVNNYVYSFICTCEVTTRFKNQRHTFKKLPNSQNSVIPCSENMFVAITVVARDPTGEAYDAPPDSLVAVVGCGVEHRPFLL